jgi:hypothetical protein
MVELAPRLDDWERRARITAGLLEVKWEIAPILLGSCHTPHLRNLVYRPSDSPDTFAESARAVCPDALEPVGTRDDNWHTLANRIYRNCDFARYRLLEEQELFAVEPPRAWFWHAVDELIEASTDPSVARRTARLLLLAHDAEIRTRDINVLRRGTLTSTEGMGNVWKLDARGRIPTDSAKQLYLGGGVETLSLDPKVRGRDLAWLFDYCETRPYGCRPMYLAFTARTATGLPVVATLDVEPRSRSRQPKPEQALTIFMDEPGFTLQEPGMASSELRPWTSYEASLVAEVPSNGRIDVVLGPEIPAATFLPALVDLQRHMHLRCPRLKSY